jgi:hypothetical protein
VPIHKRPPNCGPADASLWRGKLRIAPTSAGKDCGLRRWRNISCSVGAPSAVLSAAGPAKVEGPAKVDVSRFRSPGSTLQQLVLDRKKVNFYLNGSDSER